MGSHPDSAVQKALNIVLAASMLTLNKTVVPGRYEEAGKYPFRIFEPRLEKTNILHLGKQTRRSASQ